MSTPTSRLIALLSLLQSRRDWPGAVLAERLKVTTRTVRRDVERLREMGYPIETTKGPDGGYRLAAGSNMPPVVFDDDQAVAITVALQRLVGDGAALGDAALRSLVTIRQVLPGRLRTRVDSLQAAIAPSGEVDRIRIDPEVLIALASAINTADIIRFRYAHPSLETADDPTERRTAEPHHLVERHGRWFLVAWDLDRDDWRTFRVDRITPLANTGPRFTRRALPGGDAAAFVAARARGSDPNNSTRSWPCEGEVIVDLPATVVAIYAPHDVVEDLGSGRCRVRSGAWSWVGLAASFARFDAPITAIEPPELREAFAVLAERFASTDRDSTP